MAEFLHYLSQYIIKKQILQISQFIRPICSPWICLLWRPPSTPSAILHNGDVLLRSAVAELGIFGTFVAKGEEVTCNKAPFLDQFAMAFHATFVWWLRLVNLLGCWSSTSVQRTANESRWRFRWQCLKPRAWCSRILTWIFLLLYSSSHKRRKANIIRWTEATVDVPFLVPSHLFWSQSLKWKNGLKLNWFFVWFFWNNIWIKSN